MIKYQLFLITSITLTVVVQALLKSNSVKHSGNLFEAIYDTRLYVALLLYATAMVFWYISSSKLEFTFMIPMHVLTIIFGGFIGHYFFEESFGIHKILAYILIISGVFVLIYGDN